MHTKTSGIGNLFPHYELGPFVLTWWSVDASESGATSGYTGPDYTNGMRTTFFSDTSRNPYGKHIAGLGDMAEGLPSEYWYYFSSGGIDYPSLGGLDPEIYRQNLCIQ